MRLENKSAHRSNNGFLLLSKRAILKNSLALSIALILVGYTVLLMYYSNVSQETASTRELTVPLRLLILILLAIAWTTGGRINSHFAIKWFCIFAVLYVCRIGLEWLDPPPMLYRPPIEFLYYFIAFTAAPFLIISSIHFTHEIAHRTLILLIVFSYLFGLLTVNFYGRYVGEITRLTSGAVDDASYISPLALSYQSALMIGIASALWSTNRLPMTVKVALAFLILLLSVPFFLGASRGAVFALGFIWLFFLTFSRNVKRRMLMLTFATLIITLALALQPYLGEGIFQRIANISHDIESGSQSAIRLLMWQEGLTQFLDAPLFGNSLQHEGFRYHPHNMFIEVLISTGAIGFVPFCLFIISVFRESVRVLRNAPQRSWVVVVFLSGFSSNLFSGSISSAALMSTGAALVIASNKLFLNRPAFVGGSSI